MGEVSEKVKVINRPLRLAAVLVGDSKASRKFLDLKKVATEKIGVSFKQYEFKEMIKTDELCDEIVKISEDESNSGVLVELPLPTHIDFQKVLDCIPSEKDVDVLSQSAQWAYLSGESKILPPAVETVKVIFEKYNIDIRDKNCAVFGYGFLVGRPVSHWLTRQGVNVLIIDEFTKSPEQLSKQADIIISGVGQPNLIKAEMVKEGVIVIDFGPDVDFENVSKKTSLITPPTGVVGPIVISAVLKNLILLIQGASLDK